MYLLDPGAVAGAASRLTAASGRTMALLSMDDQYSRARRISMNKPVLGMKDGFRGGGRRLILVL